MTMPTLIRKAALPSAAIGKMRPAAASSTILRENFQTAFARGRLASISARTSMSESRGQFVDHAFEEPRGDLEQSIARIIAEVLDIDHVGRTDSFYDFGGTSLEAIRICARLEYELVCQAQPVWLFTSDIIADFAHKVQAACTLATDAHG
jgi:acyl carrier protein